MRAVHVTRALRGHVAVLLTALGAVAPTALAIWLRSATHALPLTSELTAIAVVTLAGAVIAMLARSAWLATAQQAGPLLKRAIAVRRKSWGAVFQRQRDPDAAGRPRPRAPSPAPAAA